ncbi:ATP-binding cassette sub-family D member 4 [Zancudomyces culisetae]|uniref:ATP-binding cassette sub-family D member 4 n=1 Tax=Zancudomyces culisetae TaxID=1213189 RepID=A0A1R1PJA0_ZANCU|nr:ATP-binding cassette sub-family D member 4 [Zancudomyces culisetae]|eukprot:OMH81064.1 ATP-binding cassette sub-family D member 4 [Zancudomyces culisetae]
MAKKGTTDEVKKILLGGKGIKSKRFIQRNPDIVKNLSAPPIKKFWLNIKGIKTLNNVAKVAYRSREPGVVTNGLNVGLGPLTAILILSKVAYEFAAYFNGIVTSKFYLAILYQDRSQFNFVVLQSVLIMLSTVILLALNTTLSGVIAAKMRLALTRYTHDSYILPLVLNKINMNKELDNPDQRITQDIDKLSQTYANVMTVLIITPALVVYYTVRTWITTGSYGPISIYVYFIVGLIAINAFTPLVSSKVFAAERSEGVFRNQHVILRDQAETISFYGAEEKSKNEADISLVVLVKNQIKVALATFPVQFVYQFFSYFGSILTYIVIGLRFLGGYYDNLPPEDKAGLLSQSSFIIMYLIFSFTTIISGFTDFGKLIGYAVRITQVWEQLDELKKTSKGAYWIEESRNDSIELSSLDVSTPTGVKLITNLSLTVLKGENLLITGKNGLGKTSLLRVIKGLWCPTTGTVALPFKNGSPDVYFLPQLSILVQGSLLDQIIYPGNFYNIMDTPDVTPRALEALKTVGLSHLLKYKSTTELNLNVSEEGKDSADIDPDVSALEVRHDVASWYEQLSPGEIQRLSIARVLFWNPNFVVMDESTSSLDEVAEYDLYSKIMARNITIISVGHKKSLERLHKHKLEILEGCSYNYYPLY